MTANDLFGTVVLEQDHSVSDNPVEHPVDNGNVMEWLEYLATRS